MRMRYRVFSIALLAVAGCAADPDPKPEGEVGVAQEALNRSPAQVDGNDTQDPQAQQYAYPGYLGQPGSGHLVVFLHGHGATPSDYQDLMQYVNSLGFYVVGINYFQMSDVPGNPTMEGLCEGEPDPDDCPGKVLAAMFNCATAGPLTVNAGTCVEVRLTKFLHYLAVNVNNNWSQFLFNQQPKWSKIVIAGHSGGGAVAAYGAQHKSVKRLVMLSNPRSTSEWVNDPLNAPAYGLTHTDDMQAPFQNVIDAWNSFDMQGDWCVDVGCSNPSCWLPPGTTYCKAHKLSTSRTVNDEHMATAQDTSYQATWEYLFTEAF